MDHPPRSGRTEAASARTNRAPSTRGRAAKTVVSLIASAVWFAPPSPAVAAAPSPTPVVLVSIDTLRSDRLPAYGFDGVETPAIDRLRDDGILFERAFSHTPVTLPSHASMLTGLLPTEHGVRENMGYRLDGPTHPSLPRQLGESGYRTGGFVSAVVLSRRTGIDEGFDTFDDRIGQASWTAVTSAQRPGEATLAAATEWLRAQPDGRFFLFLHLFEPHRPWEAPEPFASRYADGYAAEIAFADDLVGRLLATLQELGYYDRALVVLTSDHGEGLGEHGELEHGPFVYREALQVPLVVKVPGGERSGDSVGALAQHIDIAPTVLDVLGLERPTTHTGESLLRLDDGATHRTHYAETYYPRIHFGWSDLASIIDFPFHYIHGPDPELYHLGRDPGETVNLVGRERDRARELEAELHRRVTTYQSPHEIDEQTRQQLASLGYTGIVAETTGPLPDPKARIHVLDDLSVALDSVRRGDPAAAVTELRAVLVEEPNLFDGWIYLGNAYRDLGRSEMALKAYQRALDVSGGSSTAALSAAGMLGKLGRLDEARTLAETAASDLPAASDLLAQIALRQGDLEAAGRAIDRAIEATPYDASPWITKAEINLLQRRYDEAIRLTEHAESLITPWTPGESYRGLYVVRGRAYGNQGRGGSAERAFLRAIEIDPTNLEAYSQLVKLYSLIGKQEEANRALRSMLAQNPEPGAYAEAARSLRTIGRAAEADELLSTARRHWPDDPRLQLRARQGG